MNPEPTRAAGLEKLKAFLPKAVNYSTTRNYVPGGVSQLSPYIRTRLLTEQEITEATLHAHPSENVGKFLQEIAWRTYWKGWLEMRPDVWLHYTQSIKKIEPTKAYQNAITGATGIDCFDAWAKELIDENYLHNHVRMWFASIWIFTLELPWELGAEFFRKHLLDYDAASNTLSWRWVAGLHTKGKHYLARASNIEKFTDGRFNPKGQLNETASPLKATETFETVPLDLSDPLQPKGRIGHLVFPEDTALPPADFENIVATATYFPECLCTCPAVTNFLNETLDDVDHRAKATRLQGDLVPALDEWVEAQNLDTVIISKPPVGPLSDFLRSINFLEHVSPFVHQWDRNLWPHATAGFFKFRKKLPEIHKQLLPAQ